MSGMEKNQQKKGKGILDIFPSPLYASTGLYFREDLREMGLDRLFLGFPDSLKSEVRRHTGTLAGIQPELGLRFLMKSGKIARILDEKEMNQWVLSLLDIYDAEGLNPALALISGLEDDPEPSGWFQQGATFKEVCGVLQHYVHGLGREKLLLEEGEDVHTDTAVIYLPARIHRLQDRKGNFNLYKLMVTHLFYQVHLGSYRLAWARIGPLVRAVRERYPIHTETTLLSDLSRFFHLFPDPLLARDIYTLLDTARVESRVRRDLPGLYREMAGLKKAIAGDRAFGAEKAAKTLAMEETARWWLEYPEGAPDKGPAGTPSGLLQSTLRELLEREGKTEDLVRLTADLYQAFENLPGKYEGVTPFFYAGELRPEEAERARRLKRESTRGEFRRELAKLVAELEACETVRIELPESEKTSRRGGASALREPPDHLLIDGRSVPIPVAMARLIEEIYEDLGAIPGSYLAVADEMSGHHFRSLCKVPEGTGYFLSSQADDVHVLHEWDYRRQGYRKNWVLLREMESIEENTGFVEETYTRYRGMIQQIGRQFERIRLAQRVLKRQKEGDDIDLDAVVASFSDWRAGRHPSESVFTRLRRDDRDIASVFLVDLSGSTSGWINEMERTALLILCEALGILGDRIAVYGFSGQTRKRCELYRVKGFDEAYNDTIRRRIAGLRAREWTRMGPPIRRVSTLLRGVEARTKLLITLSDGKPDDYDAYKGDYAVEDTRQALLEARNTGIHPFCITIDKAEHGYIKHMYGPGQYIFINDLSKLPVKIPEIYRKLTA
jgi:nitric oxide reductase NorD protein